MRDEDEEAIHGKLTCLLLHRGSITHRAIQVNYCRLVKMQSYQIVGSFASGIACSCSIWIRILTKLRTNFFTVLG